MRNSSRGRCGSPEEKKTSWMTCRSTIIIVERLFRFPTIPAEAEARSARIVHVELDRVRRHFEALDFGHLQLDIAVDEVVVEHAVGLQEGAVLVEVLECLAKRAADGRDLLQLFL